MSTFFRLEINDVKNPEGEYTTLDITNYSCKDDMIAQLAENLNCEEDDLDFEDSWMDAEEDFILDFLDVKSIWDIKDETFDNISLIENSDVSLDIIEAAYELSSSNDVESVMEMVKDRYVGKYDSNERFAEEYCEEQLGVTLPSIIQGCVDWDRVWESSLRHDHSEYNDHYFRD